MRDVREQLENLFVASKTLYKPDLCAICFQTLKSTRKRAYTKRRKREGRPVKQELGEIPPVKVEPENESQCEPNDSAGSNENNPDDENLAGHSKKADKDYDPVEEDEEDLSDTSRNDSDGSDGETNVVTENNSEEQKKFKPGQKLGLQEVITDLDPKVLDYVGESVDPKQSFQCKFCEKRFAYANKFVRHLDSHPEVVDRIDKPFKCSLCSARFLRRFNLKTHRRSHSDDRPYKCSYPPCTASFKDKHTMMSHETMHIGCKKPHVCEFCSKAFKKRYVLETHKRVHTGARPYMCKFCGFCCSQKQNLVIHERQHTKERPFQCKFCDKGFFQMIQLQRHEMDHTGQRPYVCEVCGYACKAKSYLQQHMGTHLAERPFKCDHCDFTSKRKENLRVHMKVHSTDKEFACSHCSKMFKHRDSLKKHEKRHFLEPGQAQRQKRVKPVISSSGSDGKPSESKPQGQGSQSRTFQGSQSRILKPPPAVHTIEQAPDIERYNLQENRMLIPHQGYSSSYSAMGMVPHRHVAPHTVIQASTHEYEPVDVVFNIL